MDITFNCEKCGQNLEVEEAGAGMTVDLPVAMAESATEAANSEL